MRLALTALAPFALAAAIVAGCDQTCSNPKAAGSGDGSGGDKTAAPSGGTPTTSSASGEVFTFTDANFQSEVLSSKEPVLVDFWATWCGPCKMVAPTVEALAGEYAGKVKVGKLDVDKAPQMARQFQATAIPMLVVFKDGKVAKKFVGVQDKDTLKRALEDALKS